MWIKSWPEWRLVTAGFREMESGFTFLTPKLIRDFTLKLDGTFKVLKGERPMGVNVKITLLWMNEKGKDCFFLHRVRTSPLESWRVLETGMEISWPGISWNLVFKSGKSWNFVFKSGISWNFGIRVFKKISLTYFFCLYLRNQNNLRWIEVTEWKTEKWHCLNWYKLIHFK